MGQRRRSRWRTIAWVVGGLSVLLLVIGGLTALRLASISNNLNQARSLIDSAGSDLEDGRLASAQTRLGEARRKLVTANGDLYTSPELDLVSWAPGLHQNLASLRDSVGVALELVNGGGRILSVSQSLQDAKGKLQVPLREGAIPVGVVASAGSESDALSITLPGASDRYRSNLVVPQLERLQRRVYAEADRRRLQLGNVARALSLIVEMSGGNGPRRYLIAVSNTAEERGSGGMVLSYGELDSTKGDFNLRSFGNIDKIRLRKAARTTLPADYKARWAGFAYDRVWRNANLGADFTVVAPVMESMYQQATRRPVDGVIQIDPAGLAAILKGIGPVTVPSVGQVTADNVADLALNKAYTRFPDNDNRREVLGDVAEAVFRKLLRGRYSSLRPLGEALGRAVAQRHILMHSNHLSAQRQIEYFDADGALPPAGETDWMHLTVQNVSGNKLDYYLDTGVAITGTRPPGESSIVRTTVTLRNTAPVDGSPTYVFGPFDATQRKGLYRGIVSLYVPTGTALLGSAGDTTTRPAFDTEGGRSLMTFQVDVPAGGERRIVLRLTLPPRPRGPYHLTLVPQPRVRPTKYAVNLDLGDGPPLRQQVLVRETLALTAGRRPLVVSGPGAVRLR